MSLIRFQPFGLQNNWLPAVDIREEADRFVLHADIPGVDPDAIDITMEDGILTIHGERKEEKRENDNGYSRIERINGQFHRRFSLPDASNADEIAASARYGVLEIVIPKQAKAQLRRITVAAA